MKLTCIGGEGDGLGQHDGPTVSVVSPCFNEEEVLDEFHRRTAAACAALGCAYEIVLVNDGSRDSTAAILDDLAGRDPHVVAVHLSRNHGHQLALTAGLSTCRGEYVLAIDADLQDPPELLGEMLARCRQGADVVYGQRRRRAGETLFKKATAHWFYRTLDALTDTAIPRDTGDFRLMSRRAVEWFLEMPERHRFVRGMVAWIGLRQEAIGYDRDPRFAGESKYPLRRMLRLAADAITGFSTKPLLLAGHLAVGTAAVAAACAAYTVAAVVGGFDGAGVSAVAALACLLSSLQFAVLLIQGQYLGRLCEESRGRPLFIIDRIERRDGARLVVPAPSRRRAA